MNSNSRKRPLVFDAREPQKRTQSRSDSADGTNATNASSSGLNLREFIFNEGDKRLHQVNFDEAIKMTTDNKINTNNSWNFALIDYFYDMNLIKSLDGNSINFQKAGATLDGCMKIYSSRIDSISTETGKLLSGLSHNRAEENDQGQGTDEEVNEDGNHEEEENDAIGDLSDKGKKQKKKVKRSAVVSFETLQLKEFDKQLNIDPLFKKILSDFDEGGTKSLLLNSLNINSNGRIVFVESVQGHEELPSSGSMNIQETIKKEENIEQEEVESRSDPFAALVSPLKDVDQTNLGVCNPLVELENVFDDVSKVKGFIDHVVGGFNEDDGDEKEGSALEYDAQDAGDYRDEYLLEDGMNEGDAPEYEENGQQGKRSNINSNATVARNDTNTNDELEDKFANYSIAKEKELMEYFDDSNQNSQGGSGHWKVAAIKKNRRKETKTRDKEADTEMHKVGAKKLLKTKKKGGVSIVSFDGPDVDEKTLLKEEKKVFLKKRGFVTVIDKLESENTLPEDLYWTTKRLASVSLKPTAVVRIFSKSNELRKKTSLGNVPRQSSTDIGDVSKEHNEVADQQFWAGNYNNNEHVVDIENPIDFFRDDGIDHGNGDTSFDNGYDYGFDAFAAFDPSSERGVESASQMNSQKVKIEPGTKKALTYSKTAKKVDVKLLKENLWKTVEGFQGRENAPHNADGVADAEKDTTPINLKLTDVAKKVSTMYHKKEREDLSTSFFFICMLHLANEHGLNIETASGLDDLLITRN